MLAIKRGYSQSGNMPLSVYDNIAKWCADRKVFPNFFTKETVAIPVPSSSLTTDDTFWAPKLLTEALVRQNLASDAIPCLSRVKPIRKSSECKPVDRPIPREHYESMRVESSLTQPTNILLVDDLFTQGSTFLGAANRIAEIYPNAQIKGFAAMRTVGWVNNFNNVWDPVTTTITLTRSGKAYRPP